MRKALFALFPALMLAGLGGCAVVPVGGYGYGYGYAEPGVSVVVPYGYYGGGYRYHQRYHQRHPYHHPHYRGGPGGRW